MGAAAGLVCVDFLVEVAGFGAEDGLDCFFGAATAGAGAALDLMVMAFTEPDFCSARS